MRWATILCPPRPLLDLSEDEVRVQSRAADFQLLVFSLKCSSNLLAIDRIGVFFEKILY